MLRNLLPDLKLALRLLRKKPGFAIAALLNLALGIGVNTAIFSVVNAVLLQPLPYAEANQLVFLWDTQRDSAEKSTFPVSSPNFNDWQAHNRSFASMSVYSFDYFNLVGRDQPERLFTAYVSPNLLTTLGVTPALGRSFSAPAGQSSPSDEVMVSNGLWKRRFASDANLVGQPLTINGHAFTVIGVLPPEFQIPRQVSLGVVTMDDVDLLVPLSYLASVEPTTVNGRATHFLHAVARLKPGVGIEQAGSEMTALASGLEQQYPAANANFTVHLVPVQQQITGRIRPALLLLLAAVGLVLLIACSNVANLLLARYAGRQKEFAIRAALGARGSRLLQQLLTESLVLGLIGGALGLLLAVAATKLLVTSNLSSDIPRIIQTGIDARVLGFTLLVSLATSVLFALAPTLQYIRPDMNKALKDGERSASTAPLSKRLRNVLVITEMALALVLLVGAGLLIKSFSRVLSVDMGFNPRNVSTTEMYLPPDKYANPAQFISFHSNLMERLRNGVGVESVATVNILPLKGSRSISIGIEGRPDPPPGQEVLISQRIVSPDYFKTMTIPLRQGRLFTEHDTAASPPVVIISQALAHKFWGNENPVGKRVITSAKAPPNEIVGVVGDVKATGVGEGDNKPEIYLPYQQQPWPVFVLLVRSSGDAGSVASLIRREVMAIDKDQPLGKSAMMEEVLADTLSQRRLNVLLLGIFGGVALLLALVGIYGVMSYTVTQRTHELGLRMALGAQPRHILKLILGQGMTLAVIGIVIGLAGALILSRYLTSLVFEISVTDPITFVVCALLLFAAAFIACYLPARRALKVFPMEALRHD